MVVINDISMSVLPMLASGNVGAFEAPAIGLADTGQSLDSYQRIDDQTIETPIFNQPSVFDFAGNVVTGQTSQKISDYPSLLEGLPPLNVSIPQPILDRARAVLSQRAGHPIQRKKLQCYAVEGDAYLLKVAAHEFMTLKTDMFREVHVPDEYYFASIGGLFTNSQDLLVTKVLAESADKRFVMSPAGCRLCVMIPGKKAYKIMQSGNYNIGDRRIIVNNGDAHEVIILNDVRSGEELQSRIASKVLGSYVIYTRRDDGEVLPASKRMYPQQGLAINSNGTVTSVTVKKAETSQYHIAVIPDVVLWEGDQYDGSGDCENISVYTKGLDGTFHQLLKRSDIVVDGAFSVFSSEKFHSWKIKRKTSIGKSGQIERSTCIQNGVASKEKCKCTLYGIELRLTYHGAERTVLVETDAKTKEDAGKYISKLIEQLKTVPLGLLNKVKKIRLFAEPSIIYGTTRLLGGSYLIKEDLLSLYAFGHSEDRQSALRLLHHELWHGMHDIFLSRRWAQIVLAIWSGGLSQQDIISEQLNSAYCNVDWREYSSEAGSILTAPNGIAPAKIPQIASVLADIIQEEENAIMNQAMAVQGGRKKVYAGAPRGSAG